VGRHDGGGPWARCGPRRPLIDRDCSNGKGPLLVAFVILGLLVYVLTNLPGGPGRQRRLRRNMASCHREGADAKVLRWSPLGPPGGIHLRGNPTPMVGLPVLGRRVAAAWAMHRGGPAGPATAAAHWGTEISHAVGFLGRGFALGQADCQRSGGPTGGEAAGQSSPAEQATAGDVPAYGVVIARIPLFFFQRFQRPMLPATGRPGTRPVASTEVFRHGTPTPPQDRRRCGGRTSRWRQRDAGTVRGSRHFPCGRGLPAEATSTWVLAGVASGIYMSRWAW